MDQNPATPEVVDDKYYTEEEFLAQTDLTTWDMAVYCGTCHVGGGFGEKDRNGVRLSMKNPVGGMDPGAAGYSEATPFNAYNHYVFELFTKDTGLPQHVVGQAPWAYPVYEGGQPVTAPQGWGQAMTMTLPDGSSMPVADGQLMMPNVKEMDCLYCHFKGYNNLMASVMTYSGAHNAAPMAGSGLMDTNSLSPTYQGYTVDVGNGKTLMGAPAMVTMDANGIVSLSDYALGNLQGNPDEANCRQCHAPSSLEDLPDMMRDFLSSAPMVYTGNFSQSFTGLAMPSFDFNAPFGNTWNWTEAPLGAPYPPGLAYPTSGKITVGDVMAGMGIIGGNWAYIPSIGFPAAMGSTVYNSGLFPLGPNGMPAAELLDPYDPATFDWSDPNAMQILMAKEIGGGNPAGTGPLYFEAPLLDASGNPTGFMDQNALKKGIVPFPRAEWFKRGDLFGNAQQEVHLAMGCAGCHMDTNTTKIDQYDADGNIVFDGKSQCDPGRGFDAASGVENGTVVDGVTFDSNNTVKKCADCHVTGKNSDGIAINTFGAPDPTAAHQAAGLTANLVQAVGREGLVPGNHLDIIDCTVCHVYKKQMAVRLLDSTSGHRFPTMVGFDESQGMLGMFDDPFGMGMPAGSNAAEWQPLYVWQKQGMSDQNSDPNWRRKIMQINMITATLWNNIDSTVDANGDGQTGRHALTYDPTTDPAYTGMVQKTYYDPWIQRDLKAGLNFGPSGFAPIPVGFGGGDYQSAYAPDGTFTGAWQYVGVYGGNIMFSTPEEIEAYKAYRNAIAPAVDGKDWTDTELLLGGAPFMITHNVRSTDQFALGKNCSDCHAAGKGFFDGGFNMTGTAIKANAGGQFMASAAEELVIVAKATDLTTAAEIGTKDGVALEVPFEELGDWDAATKTFTPNSTGAYKRVTDLDRSVALYPAEASYIAADGTTYASRADWVAYLNTLSNPADFGIGVDPVAVFTAPTTEVTVNTAFDFVADTSANTQGSFTYSWLINDGNGTTLTGATASHTFTTTGSFLVTLYVEDEEGKRVADSKYVKVVAPAPDTTISYSQIAGTNSAEVTFGNMPTHTRLLLYWGDGTYQWVTDDQPDLTVTKAFRAVSTYDKGTYYQYLTRVYVYNGSTRVDYKTATITLTK
ncbi:MAG: PKD domain-containing protein [Desulfuromonadales bacterium]